MMLVISLILALLPILGVGYVVLFGSPTTVDGLFVSLMLLGMSGIFALNAFLEFRRMRAGSGTSGATGGTGVGAAAAGSGAIVTREGLVQRGRVENVQFYEAPVGRPNKSIVVLSNGSKASHTLVLDGDVRNALPVGQQVEVTFRKESGSNVLLNVRYS